MTYWMRCYWAEDDIWFHLEVGDQDMVVRQVELRGPARVVTAAACDREWQQAFTVGAHADYESRYGSTAEVAVTHWGEGEGFAPQTTTAEEFEDVWTSARAQIAERSQ
jgi:hypothetical protein